MKIFTRHLAVLSLSATLLLAGCNSNNNANRTDGGNTSASPSNATEATATPSADKLKVKTSFYPMYEFTRNVAGELADVENLIPAGIEPHDWEPTPQDVAGITDADVLIYNGAGMEGWVDQVLNSVADDHLVVVEASRGLEIMDGFVEEEEHEEGEHANEEEGHDHGGWIRMYGYHQN